MQIKNYYRELFLKYGDSAKTAQYPDREAQEKRYKILMEVGDLNNSSILDFGCGTAHLATYLTNQGVKFNYTGVDIVEEILDFDRKKYPEFTFCNSDEALKKDYDYIFISGMFNNIVDDNILFYQNTIKMLFSNTIKGLSFNMLSSYVDFKDVNLFYEKPEEVFSFLKNNVSPYITLRNEYQLKEGVIPYEFTVYVYRK